MATFQSVLKGGSIGPGASFPENCYFEGVTIIATCQFGKGSIFKKCKFQKCCPKHNQNPPSQIKESIVEDCTLESVSIDAKSLSINNKSTGYKVQDMGVKNPRPQAYGTTAGVRLKWDYCGSDEVPCPNKGVLVAPPAGKGQGQVHPLIKDSCDPCDLTLIVGSGSATT